MTRLVRLAAAATAAMLALTACGGDDGDDGATGDTGGAAVSEADVQAALDKGGNLLVWAWDNTIKDVVTGFQAKYPKVKVELVNAGTGDKQYTAVQNAIAAGSGVPDVAQIEYYALPQFALAKSVANLGGYGAGGLQSTFTPGPWNAVNIGGGTFGLPIDSGPMALFYNKEVFDKHGIQVPATWTEYVEAARKLHKADPKAYITGDTGDAGFTTSMIWQAGGKPYQVDGTNVTINFADPGSTKFATTWQPMITEKLVAPIPPWTDEWFKALADGTIASLPTGAWMPGNLASGAAAASGKWRVAPMPQWEAGGTASAENGGSSLAVPEKSANKALAYAFVKYAAVDEGKDLRLKAGAFPATSADLSSPAFLGQEFPYFGGQKANEIFAKSAQGVVTGWSYLPFQVYANSIFNDTVGKAYVSPTSLADALKSWQDQSAKYGTEQGFTVK
ncbi:ABC transporter substrate-binding protein [Paractinoplanes rishiriensis]|uniref:Sugar ABC transporter substrate-binding protein n=1 Tax=Paractinoplanes rishiriensis TaxID=1050105 RepID=A0A919K0B7_9ACTN|nr:sugar ABC transporter substrate-binding protein [Actinoplanes rishiriensis]GIE98551.1 sugar ABC transporter substrate-binding protein [Actinoplanes rishiriensis]